MTTAEQTEGDGACVSLAPANGGTPMAYPTDVCEAFWCVSCVLWLNKFVFISVHSWLKNNSELCILNYALNWPLTTDH